MEKQHGGQIETGKCAVRSVVAATEGSGLDWGGFSCAALHCLQITSLRSNQPEYLLISKAAS